MFGRIRPSRKRFSAALVQVGKEQGFKTQPELAKCLGVTARTLRNWIKGKKPIDFEKVEECEPIWLPFIERVAQGERAVRNGRVS